MGTVDTSRRRQLYVALADHEDGGGGSVVKSNEHGGATPSSPACSSSTNTYGTCPIIPASIPINSHCFPVILPSHVPVAFSLLFRSPIPYHPPARNMSPIVDCRLPYPTPSNIKGLTSYLPIHSQSTYIRSTIIWYNPCGHFPIPRQREHKKKDACCSRDPGLWYVQ